MTMPTPGILRQSLRSVLMIAFVFVAIRSAKAQNGPYQRTFHQSKNSVERALKELQPALSGRLPGLEGFALPGEHPLNRYQRAYYQSDVRVSSTASGESVVRVTTKVTAWYADSIASHAGYQLLNSNGRLESDFLDQLSDLLASRQNAESSAQQSSGKTSSQNSSKDFPALNPATSATATAATKEHGDNGQEDAVISAPGPQRPPAKSPEPGGTFSSSWEQGLSGQHLSDTKTPQESPAQTALQTEAASLEEVLKNQAHPKNLVAIKKSGTPVVATPSITGKTLFMASAHDEFEMLDFNADWVHVRISGLSRGWIWRTSLEMPEGISDVPPSSPIASPVAADLFQVTREETASFPGDWEPLRGKNVKIISVQKIQESEKNSGAEAKLEFAKSLLDKSYADLAAKSQDLSGVVLIFDSVDGGMIAATLPTVRQWKAGTLSDAGLWHQCYFDPPETFTVSSPSGGH
jgi:hypothetical protein